MPENNTAPTPPPKPADAQDAGHVPMTEEFDRAKWTLPPVGVVVAALLVVAAIIAVVAVVQAPRIPLSGSLGDVAAAETQDKNVLVAINLSLRNTSEKAVVLQKFVAKISTDKGEFSDDSAASASDFDRYFQAFPALKATAQSPLAPETKIPIGASAAGTIIVSFPVDKATFDGRKSLSVEVVPYYVKSLTLTK